MKILAVGDIVGEGGLEKLKKELKPIQEEEKIDFTVVNAENCSGGSGLTQKDYNELCKLPIDVMTMGNHTWGKADIYKFINNNPRLIRPANYSKGVPGSGYTVIQKNGKKFLVINLIGRTGMQVLSDNPFTTVDKILSKEKADYIIVDFHAEATAEKLAMAYYLDGRVNVLFGTHTHVQTADEMIMEKGTGYITDLGMTGPTQSIIGMDIKASLKRFLTSIPERYKLAEGDSKLNSVVFEFDDEKSRIKNIYRVNK